MKLLILLLTLPMSLLGQTIEFEKTDSIQIDTLTFSTYVLKINNYSATDPAKVFVVPIGSFDSLKTQIQKVYFSKKQEYNEYYVLGVSDIFQWEMVKRAVTEFLIQVDNKRAARNRSTFLRPYQSTTNDLHRIVNLHFLNSTKDLCKYMICTSG